MPEEKSPAALGFAPVSCIVLVRALPAGERWWRWEAEANRGWTGPAERIPGAGCPTAQARYAVGTRRKRIPKRGRAEAQGSQAAASQVTPWRPGAAVLGSVNTQSQLKIGSATGLLPRPACPHPALLIADRATCPSDLVHSSCDTQKM